MQVYVNKEPHLNYKILFTFKRSILLLIIGTRFLLNICLLLAHFMTICHTFVTLLQFMAQHGRQNLGNKSKAMVGILSRMT